MTEDEKRDQAITGMLENNDLRDETTKQLLATQENIVNTLDKNTKLIKSMAETVILFEKRIRNVENALKNLLEILTKMGIVTKWEIPKDSRN